MEESKPAPAPKAKKPLHKRVWVWVVGVIALLIVIGSMQGGESSTPPDAAPAAQSAPAAQAPAAPPAVVAVDGPALAASARAAAESVLAPLKEPLGRDPIRSVTADPDGLVMITLSFTKAFYIGDSGTGQQGASDLAAGIATAVFKSAPAATRVTVFDADKVILDAFNKKDLAK